MSAADDQPTTGTAPFILPGPITDRETVDGWRRWRLNRHAFVPAPRLSLADYRLLSPRRRHLHDLHRAATHANLPMQDTPMSLTVTRMMRSRLQSNALKHKPTTRAGLMITGGGYQGKTETACEIAAAFEDAWLELHAQLNPNAVPGTRDLHAPVAYVQTPVTAKPKSTCEAILDFFGADHHKMTLPQLTRSVRTSLHDHGVRALLLDDITRLKMHRADDQDTLDLLRAFMSMHTTLILIGVDIPGSGLLREGRHDRRTGQIVFPPPPSGEGLSTQTERRFDLVHLEPFRYDTAGRIAAWTAHLTGLEQHLRLLNAAPAMLTDATMPEYLFRRTGGVVGLLERLIEDGCAEALDSGEERLTQALLDRVVVEVGDDPTRDASAGEIPPVPPVDTDNAARRRPAKRGRNTVFDDRGIPAADSARSA
ncbi:TniB family NTP-binding protein [Micromonospora sp. WMMD980]|uniref:AAA family ATPase n=1 Tax=Micromonospora sp. WMMD980 TaxID=3016088 RepID=UPI002417B8BE|nr:TniB family NTP-binding protein [Micromonospora sp. WMMD980]MDG4803190.1 TniB family NTP-binding protein [Micromonospora sp. WMMD980]